MTTTMNTGIVRKDSIEELCNHRTRALELYLLAFDSIFQAQDAHRRACVGQNRIAGFPVDLVTLAHYTELSDRNTGKFMSHVRQMVDRDMWQGFVLNTPLGSLMDRQERDRFEESLKKDPPEAIPENVFATMARLAGDADAIFRRGLANAFSHLSRDFASHDGFKLGSRIILSGLFRTHKYGSETHLSLNNRWDDELRDVERVFAVLDGKPQPDRMQGISAAIREAVQSSGDKWEVQTDYFTLRWFLNGNGHLWFRRDDLMQQANKILAEHYGDALGHSRRRK